MTLTLEARSDAIRRRLKESIAGDPARRAAWELLVGSIDWGDLDAVPPYGSGPTYYMGRPDMILPFADGTEGE